MGRFQGEHGGIGSFTAESRLDRTYFNVEIGMDILTSANWIVSLNSLGQISSNTQTYGGGLNRMLKNYFQAFAKLESQKPRGRPKTTG